jgi:N12 class adenine-specific DNA methylase
LALTSFSSTEADVYKNLFYTTKMNHIAGLPNSANNGAFEPYIKTRYVRELTGGRGVVFTAGTGSTDDNVPKCNERRVVKRAMHRRPF